jgi:hypothetical protein
MANELRHFKFNNRRSLCGATENLWGVLEKVNCPKCKAIFKLLLAQVLERVQSS